MQLTGAQKPCRVCAELCPFGGSCSWGHMQTIPNVAELTLHVCPKPEGVQVRYARRQKRRSHAKAAVLLDNATSPVAIRGVFLGISNVFLEHLSMNAVLRHVGQAMHEANDLVPPPMRPWHLRQLPENDCRGDTSPEAAKLPQEGYLDISHLLNVTR